MVLFGGSGGRPEDSGQGEDVADMFASLITAGGVVCYITMSIHFVFHNISAKKEAFVWKGGFHC